MPGLGVYAIHAKIDTGAYTSSLHCTQVQVTDNVLEFVLLDEEHPEFTGMKFRFKKFTQKEVKNSFGIAELRYAIVTELKLYDEIIETEFTLSDRDNLRFPILVGRKILRHRFLIDVTKKDLSFRHNRRLAKKKRA